MNRLFTARSSQPAGWQMRHDLVALPLAEGRKQGLPG